MLGNFAYFFVIYGFFFNYLFQKNLSGIPSESQSVWIQIRTGALSGLIWVQTVCKAYQQMTNLCSKELQEVINKLKSWAQLFKASLA